MTERISKSKSESNFISGTTGQSGDTNANTTMPLTGTDFDTIANNTNTLDNLDTAGDYAKKDIPDTSFAMGSSRPETKYAEQGGVGTTGCGVGIGAQSGVGASGTRSGLIDMSIHGQGESSASANK
jgi:hypothetical protein